MPRAPFQVIVFPYRRAASGVYEYAVFFRRSPNYGDFWQAISGGGEDYETPLEAARRESNEEAGLSFDTPLVLLDSIATIPAPSMLSELTSEISRSPSRQSISLISGLSMIPPSPCCASTAIKMPSGNWTSA